MPTKPSIKSYKLSKMKDGWFIGDFLPSAYRIKDFEVALKFHRRESEWSRHAQKKAIEINLVVSGLIEVNGKQYERGDIFIIPPMLFAKPRFITDCQIVCVKVPSLPNDKVILSWIFLLLSLGMP